MFYLLLLSFFFVVNSSVFAVDSGINIVTSPLPINLVAEPGATVFATLKIKNGGAEAESLEVGVMKFSAFGDEGKPRLLDREAGDDYFDWISFSDKEFVLNPGEWKTITANITVPFSAAFGYYYAITFQRKNEEIEGGPRSTKVVGATASLILLEVRVPNAVREVEVLEFSTPKKIYEFLPTNFFIKLKNKGNVHVAPRGNIFIERWGQKDVAILNINELKGNVLPDSNRIFDTSWKGGFPVYEEQVVGNTILTDTKGKPNLKLKWDLTQLTKLRWGKYTANLLLVYDDGKRDVPIEGSLEFWVMPWRLIVAGLLILLLVLRGLYSMIKPLLTKLILKFKKQS